MEGNGTAHRSGSELISVNSANSPEGYLQKEHRNHQGISLSITSEAFHHLLPIRREGKVTSQTHCIIILVIAKIYV